MVVNGNFLIYFLLKILFPSHVVFEGIQLQVLWKMSLLNLLSNIFEEMQTRVSLFLFPLFILKNFMKMVFSEDPKYQKHFFNDFKDVFCRYPLLFCCTMFLNKEFAKCPLKLLIINIYTID